MLATMPPAVSQVALFAQESAEPTFWQDHGDEISAAITVLVAIVVALLVDRLVIARGAKVAARVSDTPMTRTTQTRLRVVRRLVFVAILVIGIALALSQFTQIKRLATGILASSAVLGLVLGLAARQTLGNLVAGVMLAITQPIRIGDRITFEEVTGRVDDLTLSYTYIDPGDGDLVVIPNEKIVSDAVTNHSTGDRGAPITVQVWLPADTDVDRAQEALDGAGAESVRLADWTPEGLVLEVKVSVGQDRTRVGDEEAALRERSQRALQAAGLLAE
jgi:small-conductance mechanosensitive channel